VSKVKADKNRNPDYPNVDGKYFSGGAGLSSTVEDYAKFLQMLINGGSYNGKRMLSRKTIELMLTNQTADNITTQFGLGFGLETAKNDALSIVSLGSFNWGGIFATTYWADPKEKLVGVVYTQIWPTTHSIAERFKVLTYQAIVD
jgi:CubicO group peptidase (beta-lactamase class C family)